MRERYLFSCVDPLAKNNWPIGPVPKLLQSHVTVHIRTSEALSLNHHFHIGTQLWSLFSVVTISIFGTFLSSSVLFPVLTQSQSINFDFSICISIFFFSILHFFQYFSCLNSGLTLFIECQCYSVHWVPFELIAPHDSFKTTTKAPSWGLIVHLVDCVTMSPWKFNHSEP